MAGNAFDTDLPFQVEEWEADGRRAIRTLAKCVSLEIATYVYEAALSAQTDKTRILVLRDRIKLLKDSRLLIFEWTPRNLKAQMSLSARQRRPHAK